MSTTADDLPPLRRCTAMREKILQYDGVDAYRQTKWQANEQTYQAWNLQANEQCKNTEYIANNRERHVKQQRGIALGQELPCSVKSFCQEEVKALAKEEVHRHASYRGNDGTLERCLHLLLNRR